MFDKLDDILFRLEEVLNQLNEPGVANDPPALCCSAALDRPFANGS